MRSGERLLVLERYCRLGPQGLELFEETKEVLDESVLLPVYRALSLYSAVTAGLSMELRFSERAEESYDIDPKEPSAVATLLENATDVDVCRLHLDAVLSEIPRVHTNDLVDGQIIANDEWDEWQLLHFESIYKIANICGIDVDLMTQKHLAPARAALAEAVNPAPTPEQAAVQDDAPSSPKKKPTAKSKKTPNAEAGESTEAWPFPKSKDGA